MRNDQLKDFEDMQVWQDAQDLAVKIYTDFAAARDFSFCDQIKRAGISISNNIAEGSERGSPADFARFLNVAKGSTGEVRSMYLLGEPRRPSTPIGTPNRLPRDFQTISRIRQIPA